MNWSKASEAVREALPIHEAGGERREDSCWAVGEELGRD